MISTILVASDGSEASAAAERFGVALAARTKSRMLGLSGWFGHQLLTTAHRFASASTLTPFAYAFIVYLTIWSILVFDEAPDRWTIMGAAVIVAAGLVIWFRERHMATGRVSERTYSKS